MLIETVLSSTPLLIALAALFGLFAVVLYKATRTVQKKVRNAKFIRDFMESIEYIDPDSPRHVDWLFGYRWEKEKLRTQGVYLEWQQEEGEFSFEDVLSHFMSPELWQTLFPGCQVVDFEAPSSFRRYVVLDDIPIQYMLMSWSHSNICVSIIGDPTYAVMQKETFDGQFETEGSVLYHELLGFGSNGAMMDVRKVRYQKQDIRLSHPEFYPYFQNTPVDIAAEFKESNENVMLLVGPRGTGKSTFLRTMVKELQNKNVFAINSQEVLDHRDTLPTMAQQPDGTLFILEDADEFCRSRESGNQKMSQLLNMIDGVSSKKFKLIVSTNLKTTKDVDEAFMRPGRCYATLLFKSLTIEQANTARASIGLDNLPDAHNLGKTTFLADALNYRENRDMVKAAPMGFVS